MRRNIFVRTVLPSIGVEYNALVLKSIRGICQKAITTRDLYQESGS